MIETLEVVDGLSLPEEYRKLLRPDEAIADAQTRTLRLPRFFYRVASWEQAREMKLTPHFTLAELMAVDCREAPLLLRTFPHYVPCAVSVLARYLEEFRHAGRCASDDLREWRISLPGPWAFSNRHAPSLGGGSGYLPDRRPLARFLEDHRTLCADCGIPWAGGICEALRPGRR